MLYLQITFVIGRNPWTPQQLGKYAAEESQGQVGFSRRFPAPPCITGQSTTMLSLSLQRPSASPKIWQYTIMPTSQTAIHRHLSALGISVIQAVIRAGQPAALST